MTTKCDLKEERGQWRGGNTCINGDNEANTPQSTKRQHEMKDKERQMEMRCNGEGVLEVDEVCQRKRKRENGNTRRPPFQGSEGSQAIAGGQNGPSVSGLLLKGERMAKAARGDGGRRSMFQYVLSGLPKSTDERIIEATAGSEKQHIVVLGMRGVGKSSLITALCGSRCRPSGRAVQAMYDATAVTVWEVAHKPEAFFGEWLLKCLRAAAQVLVVHDAGPEPLSNALRVLRLMGHAGVALVRTKCDAQPADWQARVGEDRAYVQRLCGKWGVSVYGASGVASGGYDNELLRRVAGLADADGQKYNNVESVYPINGIGVMEVLKYEQLQPSILSMKEVGLNEMSGLLSEHTETEETLEATQSALALHYSPKEGPEGNGDTALALEVNLLHILKRRERVQSQALAWMLKNERPISKAMGDVEKVLGIFRQLGNLSLWRGEHSSLSAALEKWRECIECTKRAANEDSQSYIRIAEELAGSLGSHVATLEDRIRDGTRTLSEVGSEVPTTVMKEFVEIWMAVRETLVRCIEFADESRRNIGATREACQRQAEVILQRTAARYG